MSRDWQFSTVQEFLRQCNWQGTTLPTLPTFSNPNIPSQRARAPQSWQSQTVQDFLSQSNWNGQLQPVKAPQETSPVQATAVISPVALNSTLPVGQFFNLFVWEAQPEIAAVPKLDAIDPPVDGSNINLSDFSDLF